MLIAAAVVPHPPVLVPEVAQGFSPDLDSLRAACGTAVGRLYAAGAEEVLIVGAGPQQGTEVVSRGSFRAYGVDLEVDGRWDPVTRSAAPMTLPFLIAAWLLRDRPAEPVRRPVMVDERSGTVTATALANSATRQAMLVLGDGSASRTLQAPGHFDERAESYDAAVARALATGDAAALAGLEPGLSRELHVAGLPAWWVLAAAATASGVEYDADLLYDQAPYGVGYFVATWLAR
ncbi:hypothetical protein ABH920_002279 [Catenulispora sp. EB89]|uniref:hypothetical protein n=1 Tax=Catenulispora sp. EB89 TaxID=3156257 RepID=UPI0035117729